ncbi:MAG: hypothetical protein ABH886_04040 [Candidatus Desantisbacteria bacterium]
MRITAYRQLRVVETLLSQIFIDIGKITLTAMVISYFLPTFAGKINWIIIISGCTITAMCFSLGILILREGGDLP